MIEEIVTSRHWPFIWPCYALAIAMFVALGVRAIVQLRRWEKAARSDEDTKL